MTRQKFQDLPRPSDAQGLRATFDFEKLADERGWNFEIHDDGPRMVLRKDGMQEFAELQMMRGRFIAARSQAKTDAMKNLARYKFSNFGYHAARWVTLNRLIGDKQPNPFRELVETAKLLLAAGRSEVNPCER